MGPFSLEQAFAASQREASPLENPSFSPDLPPHLRQNRQLWWMNMVGMLAYLMLGVESTSVVANVAWPLAMAALLEWQLRLVQKKPFSEKLYTRCTLALGLGWSFGSILLFPRDAFASQALAAFLISVVAVGSSVLHYSLPTLGRFLPVLILIPFLLRLAIEPGNPPKTLSFFLLTLVGLLVRLSKELRRQTVPYADPAELLALRAQVAKLEDEAIDSQLALTTAKGARTEFVAMVAHEIRTPLNGIIGISDLLARKDLPGEVGELTKTLQSSTGLLLALVNDLLDMSKVEANQLKVEPQWFSLSELLTSIVASVASRAEAKGLRLVRKGDAELPDLVLSDPTKIRQVLTNLLDNAIRFTDRGEVEVKGVYQPDSPQGGEFRLSVSDSGIGIAPQDIAKLFKAFGQIKSDKSQNRGGTGLGLYLCKAFAELLDGTIQVESLEGRGTTFHFQFRAESQRKAKAVPPPPPPVVVETAPRPFHILVVDDNSTNRMVAQKDLKELGHDSDAAEDGLKAIEALREKDYQLVFMDMMMPHLDGIETTRRVRAEFPREKQPFIVGLTANTKKSEHEQCLAVGMDAFYPKPIKLEMLAECIRRVKSRPSFGAAPVAVVPAKVEPPPVENFSLDEVELIRLRGLTSPGEKDFLDELIDEFVMLSQSIVTDIKAALTEENYPALASQAHKLQGNARSVGARALVRLIAQMEEAAESKSKAAVEEKFSAVQAELQQVVSILTTNWKSEAQNQAA